MRFNHLQDLVATIICVLSLCTDVKSQTDFWQHTGGPLQSEVDRVNVLNDDRIIVGTQDGWLFQSKADGTTWTPLGRFNAQQYLPLI